MSDGKKRKVVAIIQARMGSTRLPGKMMMDICGKPMLQRVIERVRLAKTVDEMVVAVPSPTADNHHCQDMCDVVVDAGASWFVPDKANEDDVLARYAEAADYGKADVIVRITADCPLIDPDVIEEVVGVFLAQSPDYCSNTRVRTYPRGLDVEVFTRAELERVAKEVTKDYDREHVTPGMYNHPTTNVIQVTGGGTDGSVNWSVNTQEDLDRVRRIYEGLDGKEDFTWQEAGVHDFCSGVPSPEVAAKIAAKIAEKIADPEPAPQPRVESATSMDAADATVTVGPPPRKIAILGTADSSRKSAPYGDKSWEIWSLSNIVITDQVPRWTRHFELHPLSLFEKEPKARAYVDWMHRQDDSKPIYLQSPEKHPGIKAGVKFPYEALIRTHGNYFTSTIAWLIALAIHEEVDEIGLWGVDLMLAEEYHHQRPCSEFYLGYAVAKGIKVTVPMQSTLLKPQQLYGIEGSSSPRQAIMEHKARLEETAQNFQAQRDKAALQMAHTQGAINMAEFCSQFTG